ncbi:hypothetical protein DIPPA_62335 [Diplonema papillatum]|nr:hypothetical protein DIPPA_62335 [Diplonema papillatum]
MRAARAASNHNSVRSGNVYKRHEHLKQLMLNKIDGIQVKGGFEPMDGTIREVAGKEVEELMRTGRMVESDLQRIAMRVRAVSLQRKSESVAGRSSGNRSSVNRVREKNTLSNAADRTKLSKSMGERERLRTLLSNEEEVDSDLWAHMCAKDVEKWNSEKATQKAVEKNRRDQQRKALDMQVAAARVTKDERVLQEKQYAEHEAKLREKWKAEVAAQEEKRKTALLTEKKQRQEQVLAHRAKLEEDDRKKREEDESILKQLQEDIVQEQLEKLKMKEQAREQVKVFIKVNKAQNEVKAKLAREEAEMDRMHQKEHLAKLEKQDRERDENLAKLQERMAHRKVLAMRLEASMQEKSNEDERRAQTEMSRKLERLQQEEKAKEERANEEKEEVKRYLAWQIDEKNKRRQEEIRATGAEKEKLQSDILSAEKYEQEKKQAARTKALHHRREVEEQIREKQHRRNVFMSRTEKALNAKKLATLFESDQPQL